MAVYITPHTKTTNRPSGTFVVRVLSVISQNRSDVALTLEFSESVDTNVHKKHKRTMRCKN